MMRTASTQTVTAVDTNQLDAGTTWTASTSPVSGGFTVVAASATKLLVVVPGETYTPGSPTGRLGTPLPQTAGVPFIVRVYQTDAEFNLVPTGTMPTVQLTSNDAGTIYVTPPNPSDLLGGQGFLDFTVEPTLAQTSFVITASNDVSLASGKRSDGNGYRDCGVPGTETSSAILRSTGLRRRRPALRRMRDHAGSIRQRLVDGSLHRHDDLDLDLVLRRDHVERRLNGSRAGSVVAARHDDVQPDPKLGPVVSHQLFLAARGGKPVAESQR